MESKYSNFGINDKTFTLLFDPYKLQKKESDKNLLDIENFTMKLTKKDKEEKAIVKNEFKHIGSSYVYNYKNKQIFFKKISDYVRDSITYQVLESKNRYGHCHAYSLKNVSSYDMATVVTAYIESSGFKYLHSWIESNDQVIDFTKNIIMEKEDYYNLVKPQIVNSIYKDDIIRDYNIIKEFSLIPDGIYCCFNEEVMRDLEKNKELIKGKPKF